MHCFVSGLDLVQTFAFSLPMPGLAQEAEVAGLDEGQYADCTGAQ